MNSLDKLNVVSKIPGFGRKAKELQKSINAAIEKLETIISQMNNILSDADLYTKNIDKFLESSKTLEISKKKLDELETRWLELDLQKNKL